MKFSFILSDDEKEKTFPNWNKTIVCDAEQVPRRGDEVMLSFGAFNNDVRHYEVSNVIWSYAVVAYGADNDVGNQTILVELESA